MIKINIKGHLEMKRNGKFKEQYCPYQPTNNDGTDFNCGDWCPLFDEPEIGACEKDYYLKICNKKFEQDKPISDMRE